CTCKSPSQPSPNHPNSNSRPSSNTLSATNSQATITAKYTPPTMGGLPILPTIASVLESLIAAPTAPAPYLPAPPTPTHSRPVSIPPPAPMPPYAPDDDDYAYAPPSQMQMQTVCCAHHPPAPAPGTYYSPYPPTYAHSRVHPPKERDSRLHRLVATSIYLFFLFAAVVVWPLVVRGVRLAAEAERRYGDWVRGVLKRREVEVQWGWVGREVVGGALEGVRRGWEVWCE
ncbi:hypothetical protein EDC01DRAFT_743841, partial [Geopyxis carbonaria]